jgi:hypothetical protein
VTDPAGAGSADEKWLDDYTVRASELWRRGSRAGADLASKWGERSLADGAWTVDTVTADLIEASEILTPLLGETVELGLELLQRSLKAADRAR